MTKVVVTGGAGFIGSHFTRLSVDKGYEVIVIDKLTYAADLKRIEKIIKKVKFYKEDIKNKDKISKIFENENPDIVVHFAAESHVDNSIENPYIFLETNVIGTQVLLDVAKKANIKKFINISTDEVYGELKTVNGKFTEESSLKPNSSYSISKCSADLLGQSYFRMYNFPIITIRPSNNYGPWQHPEKLIPFAVSKILNNQKVPIYGNGENIREWLYVKDCVKAVLLILEKGSIGEIYNVASGDEKNNLEIVRNITRILNKKEDMIKFVNDRLGHDFRYSTSFDKLKKKLLWKPDMDFNKGIEETVRWYETNRNWSNSKIQEKFEKL